MTKLIPICKKSSIICYVYKKIYKQYKNNVDSNDDGYFDASAPAPKKKEVKEEGQTLKPKKVVLKQQPQEQPKQEAKDEEEDSESDD